MANSSTVQSGTQSLIQDNIGSEVTSFLFPRMVVLYLLLRKNGEKQGVKGLGRPMVDGKPNTGIYVAGKKVPAVTKESIMGALEFKPLIQFQQLQNYTTNITQLHQSDPAVENWEDNQIESTTVRPSYRWSIKSTPIEVSLMNMRMTKSSVAGVERKASAAIGEMWRASSTMALDQHCQGINTEMIGSATPSTTTDAPTSITADLWSRQYSIPSILHNSNNYAGIDRNLSDNAWFRGGRNTTSQSLDLRSMANWARYTVPVLGPGGATIATGLNSMGTYLDCLIMGNDLFPSALAQLDALKGQVIHTGGFPDFPEVGYNRQVGILDGSLAIICEPNWPAGYVAGLSLDTWFAAIHPDANFTASDPERQNKTAGGHRSFAATIETQYMFGCTAPQANVAWTAVTA